MPIDRGIVDQQLQALGESSRWWDERELRDLPAVLQPGEEMLAIARGKIARGRWLRRSWLIVVTDSRLLFMRSAAGSGWRQREVKTAQITRTSLRVGPFHGRVLVVATDRSYRLLVPRGDAYKLQRALATLGTPARDGLGFGPVRMVHRVIHHVLALPAAALGPEGPDQLPVQKALPVPPELEERVQSLEEEVQELRQQVEFLEQLLRERQAGWTAPS
jgi:hypothetical protein